VLNALPIMRITTSFPLIALVALFCSSPSFARAADVAFFPVETTNLAPADSAAVGELLAQAYAGVSRQAVLGPSRTEQTLSTAVTYEQAAQTMGVKEYVRMSALAVGQRIVIQAHLYGATGQLVSTSKMTAETIEDMTVVSDRMARALFEGVDDEQVRTYKNVTLSEARPKSRMWSEKVTGVKTGVHMPFAKNADLSTALSLEFDMRLEQDKYFLEFGAGVVVPTELDDECWDDEFSDCSAGKHGNIASFTAEIGASRFLTDGNVALYAGGGFIPRLALNGNDIATASVYGQLGMMLPRESSTRFYTDLRVAQYVTTLHLDNNYKRHPTEISVHVGIGW
jgi:hypothetical protein